MKRTQKMNVDAWGFGDSLVKQIKVFHVDIAGLFDRVTTVFHVPPRLHKVTLQKNSGKVRLEKCDSEVALQSQDDEVTLKSDSD